jgi:ectoine hydroxylase-related dioxygenase (phytanoyl-CoA dioxygenase family)
MFEPTPAPDLPEQVPFTIVSPPQYSEAALRVTGHPDLLAIAETIHGEDFTPFTEAMIFKKPGEGASFAWHQDGTTHWDSPDWDMDTHGFNFMVQLYGSTAATGVWYLPGTHASGKVDLKTLIAEVGSDRLPDAVPLICNPGDVCISNRQIVHGSFANTSGDWRVTLNFGFHRRSSILGATGFSIANDTAPYDAERIRERSKMIGYAIDARRQRFPGERPFVYQPHARSGESFRWDDAARAATRGYNRNDLII